MYSIYNNKAFVVTGQNVQSVLAEGSSHKQYRVPQTLRDTVPAEPGKRIEGHLPKIFDHVCNCDESEDAVLNFYSTRRASNQQEQRVRDSFHTIHRKHRILRCNIAFRNFGSIKSYNSTISTKSKVTGPLGPFSWTLWSSTHDLNEPGNAAGLPSAQLLNPHASILSRFSGKCFLPVLGSHHVF